MEDVSSLMGQVMEVKHPVKVTAGIDGLVEPSQVTFTDVVIYNNRIRLEKRLIGKIPLKYQGADIVLAERIEPYMQQGKSLGTCLKQSYVIGGDEYKAEIILSS